MENIIFPALAALAAQLSDACATTHSSNYMHMHILICIYVCIFVNEYFVRSNNCAVHLRQPIYFFFFIKN